MMPVRERVGSQVWSWALVLLLSGPVGAAETAGEQPPLAPAADSTPSPTTAAPSPTTAADTATAPEPVPAAAPATPAAVPAAATPEVSADSGAETPAVAAPPANVTQPAAPAPAADAAAVQSTDEPNSKNLPLESPQPDTGLGSGVPPAASPAEAAPPAAPANHADPATAAPPAPNALPEPTLPPSTAPDSAPPASGSSSAPSLNVPAPPLSGAEASPSSAPEAPLPEPANASPHDEATKRAEELINVKLQGEYEGELRGCIGALGGVDFAGIQVVSVGGDKFFAVIYPGGLPGTGWNRRVRYRVEGQRHGDLVQMQGDGMAVSVVDGIAQIDSASGTTYGLLDRVRRRSATLGKTAPPGAQILFDGSQTTAFKGGRINESGHLMVGTELQELYRDFVLHVEFRLPYMPEKAEQARGNSGIYLQSRYEVQILDSFGLPRAFNECGSLYRQRMPEVNMCLPPLAWQTYDIQFRSPRFDAAGQKIQNARLTVYHNSILVHDNIEILAKTGAGQPEGPELLPIKLQDHGDPVEFRNIWIVRH